MTREFRARRRLSCSPEEAFDFVADYRNVRKVLEGVSRWRRISPETAGVGARFNVEMRAAGLSLGGVLVLERWERPRQIGWISESGLIRQRGGWRFRAQNGGTEVELTIAYDPPGAVLGNLVAARVDGLIRHRLEQALERMAELLDSPGRGSAPP